ncbi:MAG TPA: hypothetical protein VFP84_09480 [Kofleriaceae bacterium]|nr:hypothetical protein [Kofleriaceae bacterium]
MPAEPHATVRALAVAAVALTAIGVARVTSPPRPVTSSPATLGTRHPILVTAIGPAHRWVVACQARRDTDGDRRIWVGREGPASWAGDDLDPYLFVGGTGEGTPIDGVVSASHDGRWVVVVRDRGLIAVDTVRQVEHRLPASRVIQTLHVRGPGPWAEIRMHPTRVSRPDPFDPAAAFDDSNRPIAYVNPFWTSAWACDAVHTEIGAGDLGPRAWIDLETGEIRDTPAWQLPAIADDAKDGLAGARRFLRVDIGRDDHGHTLRETQPRPDPSALPWGPLRWDTLRE